VPAQTRERILDTSLAAFGLRGYDSTSLDELASDLGITKQAILYHFSSKEHLLNATIELAVKELGSALGGASKSQARGFQRIEDLVRATFSLAARRPEVLGLVRLVSRQGGAASGELASAMSVMLGEAVRFVEAEMIAGRFRRLEPRMLLLAVYSAVIGVATEPEVMRALGLEPDLRSLVKARREIIEFLRAALVAD
tara:strand:+ start:383 stop:973 length:591 start_codon:yes stop_codon:yes gene_type:complete